MSATKKHSRSEGEEKDARLAKKVKTDEANVDGEVKKEKKEKKDKKDKKEKKDKKSKKEKKEESETPATESTEDVSMPDADATPAAESEPVADKKEKKEKKDKKEKKEKKDKKEKKSKKSDESTTEESASASKATTNGTSTPAAAPAPATNGAYTYKQADALSALPESEIETFLREKEIVIKDPSSSGLRPIINFSQLPQSNLISKNPFKDYTNPTPIQSASWPFSLSGRDVIGIAETGSGKTMAFAVPCVESLASRQKPKFNKGDRSAKPRAVIVSPTRELAMQTHAALSGLASLVGLSAVCIYGGSDKNEQRTLLYKNNGVDIITATPGRLKDFLSDGTISLANVSFAVLDEADRMLDRGFSEDIKQILSECPPREQRQTLMFTATWPLDIQKLAESYMINPAQVTIGHRTRAGGDGEGNGNIELQANSRIEQTVEVVDPRGKEFRLYELLKEAQKGSQKNDRILVFCLYKKEAVRVEQFLSRKGIRVASIHGDLRQDQRTKSLEAFKSGSTTVLVATDVAARGLDIPEVKLVINVTFPLTIEDYVHRIGRTGRAGKKGKAITLFTEHDKAHSGSLVNILRAAKQPVPEELLKFGTTVKKKAHDAYGAFYKDVDPNKKATKITFD
ncbi:ATP-dependent RNA helicase dbp-3 [Sordaria brevicollis]|uniref:RNA helicase n=1 Tax=Sordaria brevicollis TaxID=83679 RepID=A0AAE0PIW5_SORBR|nr:ATP-dependent RNA helicase dbp-3 [Sordaria brevicollis]